MIGHYLAQEAVKTLAVVGVDQVAELMGDHIVHAAARRQDQVARQHHISAIGDAAPTMCEVANDQSGWGWAVGYERFEKDREPLRIKLLCLIETPVAEQLRALVPTIGPVHAKNDAVS